MMMPACFSCFVERPKWQREPRQFIDWGNSLWVFHFSLSFLFNSYAYIRKQTTFLQAQFKSSARYNLIYAGVAGS